MGINDIKFCPFCGQNIEEDIKDHYVSELHVFPREKRLRCDKTNIVTTWR
jgi:predicted restriction endonuclease